MPHAVHCNHYCPWPGVILNSVTNDPAGGQVKNTLRQHNCALETHAHNLGIDPQSTRLHEQEWPTSLSPRNTAPTKQLSNTIVWFVSPPTSTRPSRKSKSRRHACQNSPRPISQHSNPALVPTLLQPWHQLLKQQQPLLLLLLPAALSPAAAPPASACTPPCGPPASL